MTVRPFRFSSPISGGLDRSGLRERVRMLDDLGYSTATMSDHFDEQLGPIAALMAVAEASDTIRIGSLVLGNDFRHPVVLAKEAATLDLLSEGRLELGLGAGWKATDYTQTGVPHDRAGVRIGRLAEALTVIKGLWGDGPIDHHGEHYDVVMEGWPKPVQRPHPPIVIGGGARRVLELAGREADIVSLNPSMVTGAIDSSAGPSVTPEATDEKLAWIRGAAGARFADVEMHIRLQMAFLVDDPTPLHEALAGHFGLTPEQSLDTPHALAGPVDYMVEQLLARRERWGLSYIGVPHDAVEAMAPVVAKLADS